MKRKNEQPEAPRLRNWEVSSGDIWATSPFNARVRVASMTQFSAMNGIDQKFNAELLVRAVKLLEWIELNYANQDLNHEDFRVEAYVKAVGDRE